MVTNETIFHKNPATGEPQPIGLGWLDDSMTPHGPTEEDKNYIADTGASAEEIAAQVAAYEVGTAFRRGHTYARLTTFVALTRSRWLPCEQKSSLLEGFGGSSWMVVE